ncbi:MAG: hypothetical protein ABIK89_26575 [Planctomycetota bacterium]
MAADRGGLECDSARSSPRLGLSIVAGAAVGFLVGCASVLLHPIVWVLVNGGQWRVGVLASTSLGIVPATMSIAPAAGGIAGAWFFLLGRGSPTFAGLCSRALLPLWYLVLCISLMFVYDAKTFGYDWFRAATWGAAARILGGFSYRLFGMLWDALCRGNVKRVSLVILIAAMLLWMPFVVRFVFP